MDYIKKSPGRIAFEIFNTIFLILLSVCFILPMWHVICCSFSQPEALNRHLGLVAWPLGTPTLAGYKLILSYKTLWRAYGWTLYYVIVGTVISMALTVTGAYCLSRKSFRMRNPIMLFVSFTMLFNGGLVPTYLVIKKLGMLGTTWSVILPGCYSVMNLIIMRTSFQEVPSALEEAARIDGANDLQIMFRVILPLTKATIAVIALFYAVAKWNSWFHASIYLGSEKDLYPLQLVLKEILVSNTVAIANPAEESDISSTLTRYLIQYTAITVATLPILCVYPFAQKYFTSGVMIGAVKG